MVTTIAPPRAARALASYWLADPAVKPPPWIQTITRRGNRTALGVYTLRKRQSSLLLPWPLLAAKMPGACAHAFPNRVASRTPDQPAAGCGARKRKLPTGGAANGMPRNDRTPLATA